MFEENIKGIKALVIVIVCIACIRILLENNNIEFKLDNIFNSNKIENVEEKIILNFDYIDEEYSVTFEDEESEIFKTDITEVYKTFNFSYAKIGRNNNGKIREVKLFLNETDSLKIPLIKKEKNDININEMILLFFVIMSFLGITRLSTK